METFEEQKKTQGQRPAEKSSETNKTKRPEDELFLEAWDTEEVKHGDGRAPTQINMGHAKSPA